MACEIGRLPEEMLSAALARTSPRDACRAAAVSPAFRAAADSDAVWACFLPLDDDLPQLADGELPAPVGELRKKGLFLRLSDGPVLLQDKLVSMGLDRENGARCYMLSATNLYIVWGDTPQYWRWIPLTDSRSCVPLNDVALRPYSRSVAVAIADGELPAPVGELRKKDLFLRLSDGPVLLQDKLVSMWLDRENGARCYMLSARNLFIVWGNTPQYWRWIPLTDSRFSEGAQLRQVCWFHISGKIPRKMLSQDTIYAAYIVFKVNDRFHGLDHPAQEASISVGETNLTRKVCLQSNDDEGESSALPSNYWPMGPLPQQRTRRRNGRAVPHGENVTLPQKREDGWMELELGEFFNEEGGDEDGEVSFSLIEIKGGHWKSGLIVQGIEIRRKKSG